MSSSVTIRPMPTKFGIGFMSETPLPDDFVGGYRYEQAGRYHNYHVTPEEWQWPVHYSRDYGAVRYVIDGFSPNLNKELHIGHLRNLAIAKALQKILQLQKPEFVALLGASQGVKKAALTGWRWWCDFVRYYPSVYYDVLQPLDVIETREPTVEEVEKRVIDPNEPGPDLTLPKLWDGPNGPVIVVRADGRPLYALYDLIFAKEVNPTHYITGHEQKEHFTSLGLGDKHLPMGLVLGEDGKKLKSRTGDAMPATEALSMIRNLLNIPDEERSMQIAWNILAWNFLRASRETNLKFEVEKWVRTESPGLYITYTYARLISALGDNRMSTYNEDEAGPPSDEDAKLLGLSDQWHYYRHKAIQQMDPAPVANYAHELARALAVAYEREKIRGGRMPFFHTIRHTTGVLWDCMTALGMFLVTQV